MPLTYTSATSLAALLELQQLEVPAVLTRGLELADAVNRLVAAPSVDLLTLDVDDVAAHVESRAVRLAGYHNTPNGTETAWRFAQDQMLEELFEQVRQAMLPAADELILSMRTKFDPIAAKLTDYVNRYGFTSTTPEGEIIDLPWEAIKAYREVPALIRSIQPYAAIRTLLSQSLDLSPTVAERQRLGAIFNDWSVLFAAGDSWSVNGSRNLEGRPQASLDWLALAKTGLTLNTIDETRAKIATRLGQATPPPAYTVEDTEA